MIDCIRHAVFVAGRGDVIRLFPDFAGSVRHGDSDARGFDHGKIVEIVASVRPRQEESPIEGALMKPENTLMHAKIKRRLLETVVPLLTEVVEEGITQGVFSCDNIPERLRMLLVISNETFDEGQFTERDVEVFIDLSEKLLGAKAGTMGFVRALIS